MEHIIFITNGADGVDDATTLHRRLEKETSAYVQWDVRQDRIQRHGRIGWLDEVVQNIQEASVVVVIITPNALTDRNFWATIRYARQIGTAVVPIHGTPPTEHEALLDMHIYDSQREWNSLLYALAHPPSTIHLIPFMAPDLPRSYIHRPREFEQVFHHLSDGDHETPIVITTTRSGIGGFGKTTLAAAICHDEQVQQQFDDGILWVTLGQQPNLLDAMARLYTAITGREAGFIDLEAAIDELAHEWGTKDYLLVIDGVWSAGHLLPFLRGGKRTQRIITTRNYDWVWGGHRVNVDEMSMPEALDMLEKRLVQLPDDRTLIRELARRLERWTIGLTIASKTISQRIHQNINPDTAMHHYLTALNDSGAVDFKTHSFAEYAATRDTIMDLSIALLAADEHDLLLALCIFPDNIEIPLAEIQRLWAIDEADVLTVIQELDDLAIVIFHPSTATVRIHSVVRAYLETQVTGEDKILLHNRLVDSWGHALELPSEYAWDKYVHHLLRARRYEQVQTVLLDFHWMQLKLQNINISDMINDYFIVQTELDKMAFDGLALRYVQGALQLSAQVLAQDHLQLAPQLIGRLMNNPSPDIQALLAVARTWQAAAWLRPLTASLTAPGGLLLHDMDGHTDAVIDLMMKRGLNHVLSSSTDGTLKIWNISDGALIQELTGTTGPVQAVAITADERWIMAGAMEGSIVVWDMRVSQPKRVLNGHNGAVQDIAVLLDDTRFISASSDHTLKVWNLETGLLEYTLEGHTKPVTCVLVLPDGERAVSGSLDRSVCVWDLENRILERRLSGHAAAVQAIALTAHGYNVLSGAADGTLIMWDLVTGAKVFTLPGHTRAVTSLAITPDEQLVISGSSDHTLKVWDIVRGTEQRTLLGHAGSIRSVVVSADGGQVISAADDSTIKIWGLRQHGEERGLTGHMREVLAFAAVGATEVVSGAGDGTLKYWSVQDDAVALKTFIGGHPHAITALVASNGGVISATATGEYKHWEDWSAQQTWHDPVQRSVTTLHIIQERLIAGTTSGDLLIWDHGHLVEALPAHQRAVRSMILTDEVAISAGGDGHIKIWDAHNLTVAHDLTAHDNWITGIAVNGDRLASVSGDGVIKLWSIGDGREVARLRRHRDWVRAVAFSPDGRHLLSGGADGSLYLWNAETGRFIAALMGHRREIQAVFFFNNRQAVTVAADGKVKVWDIDTHQLLARFTGESAVRAALVLPNMVVTGEQSGQVHFLSFQNN